MYSYIFTINLKKVSNLFFKDMPEVSETLILRFNFIVGLKFISVCFKLIIIH